KDELQQLKEDYHPLLNEESLLYLPADIGYLESDQGVLVRQFSLFHSLELTFIEMEVVFIELEILLLKFLVKISPEVTAKDLLAPCRNPGRVHGRDNGKNMYQRM